MALGRGRAEDSRPPPVSQRTLEQPRTDGTRLVLVDALSRPQAPCEAYREDGPARTHQIVPLQRPTFPQLAPGAEQVRRYLRKADVLKRAIQGVAACGSSL
eukprot:5963673-Pyramimonas_sp.AAC.1